MPDDTNPTTPAAATPRRRGAAKPPAAETTSAKPETSAEPAETSAEPAATKAATATTTTQPAEDEFFAAFGAKSVVGGGIDRRELCRKILVFGDSGAGKTHLAATCDERPLIISVEPQGIDTIASANPRAMVIDCVSLSKEKGPMQTKIAESGKKVTPLEVLRAVMRDLMSNPAAWHKRGVRRIGIDSLHVIQQLFAAEIIAETNRQRADSSKEALDQLAKDGWGVLSTKMQNFCDQLRALKFDVLVVAISRQRENGPKTAALQGSFGEQVAGYFNAVGYLYRQQIPGKALDEVERLVAWNADSEKLVVKAHSGVKGITLPNAASWFDAMASDANLTVANARLPNELRTRRTAATGGATKEAST